MQLKGLTLRAFIILSRNVFSNKGVFFMGSEEDLATIVQATAREIFHREFGGEVDEKIAKEIGTLRLTIAEDDPNFQKTLRPL